MLVNNWLEDKKEFLYEENRNLMIDDNKKWDSAVLMVYFNFDNLTNNTYL